MKKINKEKKEKKEKIKLGILWHYLKDDKVRLTIYIILVVLSYLPTLLAAIFWGKATEELIAKNTVGFIKYLALWEGIYILFYSILSYPRELLYNYLEIKFMRNVTKDLYKKIDKLPVKAFEDMGVGEYINRIYTDPDRIMELLSKMIRMFCKATVVLLVIVIAFKISLVLFAEILIFAIIMGFISFNFFPKIKKTQEKIKKESDAYVKTATENITGIREIKSLGIKKIIENRLFKNVDDLFKHSKKIKKQEALYYNINNFTYYVLQFIILATCGYLFFEGKIAFSIFMMLETYIWRIDEVVEGISDLGVSYNKVKVSLRRIDELINNKLYKDEKFGKKELIKPKGVVEFKKVIFRYSAEEDYTLKGLNLLVKPNKKVAIVGKSGNGKSTLFNLLLRYFDATRGEVLIDGINIKDLSEESLRSNVSIIRQTPFLFNLSIMDNFRLVKENVTLEEVIEVCEKAYINDYIMSLPKQYETIIGEGGVNLSGGQKQRIAIARTLLLNTKIILFDEATSALDNESQEYIKKTIDNLVKDHTVIIVAHRLSTIIDADVINVIDNGRNVATGTNEQLLENCDVYKALYTSENKSSNLQNKS